MNHPCSRLSILTFGDEFFGALGQYIALLLVAPLAVHMLYILWRIICRNLPLSHQPLVNSSSSLIETTNIRWKCMTWSELRSQPLKPSQARRLRNDNPQSWTQLMENGSFVMHLLHKAQASHSEYPRLCDGALICSI